MSTPQKVCPQCHSSAPIQAQFCGVCRHQFRTQFTSPDQTIMAIATPSPANSLSHKDQVLLDEYSRQYQALQDNRRWGCLLCLTGIGLPIYLALYIWNHFTYTELRRRVAELDVRPDEWESGLKRPSPWVWLYLIVTALVVLMLVMVVGYLRQSAYLRP